MKRVAAVVLAFFSLAANAQDQNVMQQGTDFANTLAPTSKSQVVNPAGVNANAWGGNSGVSSTVPANMGTFSAPITTSSTYTQAKSLGLTGLGESALDRCASYKPTGNPVQDQECAAVNFLAQKCLSPSDAEKKILGNSGVYQSPSADCEGTYGQAQKKFDFINQITPNDPAFTLTKTAQQNAASQNTQTCTPTTVVTTPAQFEVNKCSKISSTSEVKCSQTLSASITTTKEAATKTDACPTGELVGGYCKSKTTIPATVTASCSSGVLQSDGSCLSQSSYTATPILTCSNGSTPIQGQCISTTNATQTLSCTVILNPYTGQQSPLPTGPARDGYPMSCVWGTSWTAPQWVNGYAQRMSNWFGDWNGQYYYFYVPINTFNCPNGELQPGNICRITTSATIGGYNCPNGGNVSGTSCVTKTTTPANITYSCTNGMTPTGKSCTEVVTTTPTAVYSCHDGSEPVNGLCTYKIMNTSWDDGCSALEKSAGTALGTP